MYRFTRHAYFRFQTRRPEWVKDPPSLEHCMVAARESYELGTPITREEAMDRVRGPIRPHFHRLADYIYRADGTGPGVWVVRISKGEGEVVLTYLAPAQVRVLYQRRRLRRPIRLIRHPRLVCS